MKYFTCLTLLLLVGCGHNRYNETKSWGLGFSIPFGDLGQMSVCLGSTESTVAMVRGGSSFSTETIAGAGVFAGAGGTAKVSTFRSNEQLNEGNVVKIMQSPDVPESVKKELAQNFKKAAEAPEIEPSAMQVREASLYANGYKGELKNQFKPTGVDKVIEETTETVEHLADDLTGTAQDAGTHITETVNTISDHLNPGKKISETITNVGDNLTDAVTRWLIIIGFIIVIAIIAHALGKSRRKKVTARAYEGIPQPPNLSDEQEPPSSEPLTAQAPQEPDKYDQSWGNYFANLWYGILEFLKSIIFFWRDLGPEAREVLAEETARKLRKKRQN